MMRSPVEKAIWYIESHFAHDITLDELASACELSRFQMSRLFSEAIGMTVTAYVRGRRLTEAARALASGAPDILRVALQAGYGSHAAFSRAFRDQFGLTPGDVRETCVAGIVARLHRATVLISRIPASASE
jgi:AraC family transcriptional regulator